MSETNLEHYKRELGKIFYQGCPNPAAMFDKIKKNYDSNIRSQYGHTYADDILNWMSQPYKEPILDDSEKKYLSAVIRPFRSRVQYIVKWKIYNDFKQFIHIELSNGDCLTFPNFKADTMYRGMEVDKFYTLQELGL